MCGIAGYWAYERESEESLHTIAQAMADRLAHRGPDDHAQWVDVEAGIALGFRRLAILDLSVEGRQPMVSTSDRYVIVYNGEIYNFMLLREELEAHGCSFRGRSDTEVMLAAFETWGLESTIERLNGMFAFGLWDRRFRSLHLVRDRLGIKPLYYGQCRGAFVFGSELKAIKESPCFEAEVDRDALALYLRFGYVPWPWSIYRGVYKLPPGTILTLQSPGQTELSPQTYWKAEQIVERGAANPFDGCEQEALHELDRLLRESVKLRLIADVPLGAFLSGGIDSSTVVALMQAQSDRPVKTFTIGFDEDEYDEASYASRIAQHLGTDHTELYVTSQQAMEVVPKLPLIYDEPFADSSQIPTFLISQLARRRVSVSLSGDGGDELFGGYNRHSWGWKLWDRAQRLPRSFRKFGAGLLTGISPGTWSQVISPLRPLLPHRLREPYPGDKIHKSSDVLEAASPEDLYWRFISHWRKPEQVVINGKEAVINLTERTDWPHLSEFAHRMMFFDLMTYLPNDILTKVDRASMAVSLEARVPLLDHRVVEFAWRLPLSMKVRGSMGKWILRQVLYQYIPKEWGERPKMGFAVPLDSWLRGPLRGWAEELLEERRIRQEGFFHPSPIRQKWDEHLSGRRNWQSRLWIILMFQMWIETQ